MLAFDEEPAVRIFLSYHKRNRALAESVVVTLRDDIAAHWPKGPKIQVWYDSALEAGDIWDPKIQVELEIADIILFLVAPACLDATYMWSDEFAVALERFRKGAGRVRLIPLVYADVKAPILTNRFTRSLNWVPEKPHDQMADVWLAKLAEGIRPAVVGVLRQGAPPASRLVPALEACSHALSAAKDLFAANGSSGFFGPVLASDIQLSLQGVEAAMSLPGRERTRALSVWEPKLRTAQVLLREALPDHGECIRQLRLALDDFSTFAMLEDASPVPPHAPLHSGIAPNAQEHVAEVKRDVAVTREVLEELSNAPTSPTNIEEDARTFTVETGTAHIELAEALLEESPIDSNALSAEVEELRQLASSFTRTIEDLGQKASVGGDAIGRKFLKSSSDALRSAIKLVSQIGDSANAEGLEKIPPILSNKPRQEAPAKDILLLGIGGAGGNAINNMIELGFSGARIVALNTDEQALARSKAPKTILIGPRRHGLGSAANPEIGRDAAEESADQIRELLGNAGVVLLAAGMGGGTGSGATRVIARIAKSMGIATFGSMTVPFDFEGKRRAQVAYDSIKSTSKFLDAYVVLENQKLFEYADSNTTFADAFSMADKALYSSLNAMVDLATGASASNLNLARTADFLRDMGECAIALGAVSNGQDIENSISRSFARPYLSTKNIERSSRALISVSGDEYFEPRVSGQIVDAAKTHLSPHAQVIESCTFHSHRGTDPSYFILAKAIDLELESFAARA